jgi:hypothetical protein
VPAAHRVVGICEVDEFRPGFPGLGEERGGVLGIVAVGHRVERAAEARDMEVEGRIGAEGGDDRIALGHEHPDEVAEEPVDAFADDDVAGRDAVMRGERGAEIVDLRVAVFPDLGRGGLHGRDGRGRGAEDALIRADPGAEGGGAAALERLGPHEGDAGGERGDEGGVAGAGQFGASGVDPAGGRRPPAPPWSTWSKMKREAMSGDLGEAGEGGGEAGGLGLLLGQHFACLFNDFLGRAFDELGVREAPLEAAHVLRELLERLAQAGLFGRDVDDVGERQGEGGAGDGDGGGALGGEASRRSGFRRGQGVE